MSEVLLAAAAALPLVAATVLLVGALWPATKAMPVAWGTAVLVAATVWQLPVRWIAAATTWGVILAVEILWIVFGALVLLYTLRQAGAIARIAGGFASLSSDHRVQTILIGFFLTTFLTGVAGFGTPAAIVAPLLVSLGFPALGAVVVALIGHAMATTFGAVGVPINPGVMEAVGSLASVSTGKAVAFMSEVSGLAAAYHLLPGLFMPVITVSMLVYFFGDVTHRSLAAVRPIFPLALFAGVVFVIPFTLTAVFIGPEMPSIIAPIVGGGLTVTVLNRGWLVPDEQWRLPDNQTWPKAWTGTVTEADSPRSVGQHSSLTDGGQSMSLARAWTPYLLVVILLIATRDFTPIGSLLTEVDLLAPAWTGIFGTTITNSIEWAYAPGTWLVAVALISIPLYGLSRTDIKNAWKEAGETAATPAVALTFIIGTVGILLHSGQYVGAPGGQSMMVALADGVGGTLDGVYTIVAAPLGVFGTFVTGSVMVSNVTFSPIQYELARELGFSPAHIVAAQAAAGGVGNAISIHNVIAALATVGLVGKEGVVIRMNLVPVAAYTLAVSILLSVIMLAI
ncbi:L-lactate permease [Halorubrum sp. RMP-47]|uniref:L-lactate permease n=1 Tax=Halorubrum miltondacostae TaxID=3076378 RepID=UPI0035287462